jgi:hypothetical protein
METVAEIIKNAWFGPEKVNPEYKVICDSALRKGDGRQYTMKE